MAEWSLEGEKWPENQADGSGLPGEEGDPQESLSPEGRAEKEEEGSHKEERGASLVAQWLGVHLPMQGTRVRAPVREDPTCRRADGPVSHGR